MKFTKAIYGGLSAAVIAFATPTAGQAKLPIWANALIGLGGFITGFNAVYWAPKNKENSNA